jgi:pyrimidine-nucleoside phosphorylase
MRATDIIMKKRNGSELIQEEIEFLISGYVCGDIPDYQMAAWLMAVFFRGMTPKETGELTRLMMASGSVLDLTSLNGPLIDKHSTGGVGDKTSLILAPVAAVCGLQVPMMSGRALGHTGGTLDKLEAIRGYNINLHQEDVLRIIRESGYVVMGQTAEVVPADRKMYALRDVTSTVESIPLITASILSKKLAEGAEGLVFDVKAGAGAFMKTEEQALALAGSLVDTGRAMGRKIIAVITSMEEPLGRTVGNFLEVEEAWECLNGQGPDDLMDVTLSLASRMLLIGGICGNSEEALSLCREKIDNGEAAECFLRNLEAQGGDVGWFKDQVGRWRAPVSVTLKAWDEGFLRGIDAFATGMCAVGLGVGRSKAGDSVQPHTGIRFFKKTGDSVKKDEVICEIFALDKEGACTALDKMRAAVDIGGRPPERSSLILREIT